jgi:hypothetical protein
VLFVKTNNCVILDFLFRFSINLHICNLQYQAPKWFKSEFIIGRCGGMDIFALIIDMKCIFRGRNISLKRDLFRWQTFHYEHFANHFDCPEQNNHLKPLGKKISLSETSRNILNCSCVRVIIEANLSLWTSLQTFRLSRTKKSFTTSR